MYPNHIMFSFRFMLFIQLQILWFVWINKVSDVIHCHGLMEMIKTKHSIKHPIFSSIFSIFYYLVKTCIFANTLCIFYSLHPFSNLSPVLTIMDTGECWHHHIIINKTIVVCFRKVSSLWWWCEDGRTESNRKAVPQRLFQVCFL